MALDLESTRNSQTANVKKGPVSKVDRKIIVAKNTSPDSFVRIDIDNDGRDDRLYNGPNVTGSVQDALNRIDHLSIENLPEPLLIKMLANMQLERDKMNSIAIKMEIEVHEQLLRGEYHIIEQTRKELRKLKREQNAIFDIQQSLEHQIHDKRLQGNMRDRIGEKGVFL